VSGAHRSAQERWHHAWAAFVLGAIAVIALGLIAFVLSTQRTARPAARQPMLLTEVPTSTTAAPSTSATPARATSRSSTAVAAVARRSTTPVMPTSSAAPSTTTRAAVPSGRPAARQPCDTSAPCVIGGTGAVQTALAAYRHAHGGGGAVPVAVTAAAQRCAVTGGDGPTCTDPFAVARERQQSGRQAVEDVGAGYGNWLLDPDLHAVEVGWAYDPPTGQYVCVLIART
jgi:hypothetical protein